MFPTVAVVELGLGGLAWTVAWMVAYEGPADVVDRLTRPELLSRDLIWGIAATLPMFAMAWLVERSRWRPLRYLRLVVHKLVVSAFSDCSTWQIALVSMLAGFGEELFFRGIMLDALRGNGGMTWIVAVALLVSSLLFGLAHAMTRAYLVLATLIGLYLGGLLLLSESLLVPMMTHAVYDFVLLEYFLGRRDRNPTRERGALPGS